MTLGSLILLLIVLVVIGLAVAWIADRFFPYPANMITKVVVGILLLVVLLQKTGLLDGLGTVSL